RLPRRELLADDAAHLHRDLRVGIGDRLALADRAAQLLGDRPYLVVEVVGGDGAGQEGQQGKAGEDEDEERPPPTPPIPGGRTNGARGGRRARPPPISGGSGTRAPGRAWLRFRRVGPGAA